MNRSPLARLTLVLALVSLFGLAAAQSPCAPGGEQTPGSTGLANGLLHVGAVLRDVQEALCRLYVLTDHERELPRFCPRPPGVCELPIEPGPCRAAIPRWGFVPKTGRCEPFVYGGCGGNANNFETREACEQRCGEPRPICKLPPDGGPCDAAIPRWYFDAGKGQCAEFIYGGCQGNPNNFSSEEACRKECGGEPIPVCQLPADVGPCTAVFRRWHFDTKSGECEPFVYGGCGGNANNFETREACEKGCSVPDVCSLGADPGPCEAAIPRWFHDPRTNRCELFTWGGCGGNANQFASLAECEQACPLCREGLCLPHQECRLYKEPTCPPGASCAPEAYCADTCERFRCPLGQVCVLQQVQCVRAPCPAIAQCVPSDPCATVRCMAPMACQVDGATGQLYCADPAP
jgi:hypothetical protein